jgi:hypothetical protein
MDSSPYCNDVAITQLEGGSARAGNTAVMIDGLSVGTDQINLFR